MMLEKDRFGIGAGRSTVRRGAKAEIQCEIKGEIALVRVLQGLRLLYATIADEKEFTWR